MAHVHNVFLPYGYPPHWHDFRFNEQQALIPWLLSVQFEQFASHFAHQRTANEITEKVPNPALITPRPGGSEWMRKA